MLNYLTQLSTNLRIVVIIINVRLQNEGVRTWLSLRVDVTWKMLKCVNKTRKPHYKQKVSEYDQEIPQSHTADQPMAPRGRDI